MAKTIEIKSQPTIPGKRQDIPLSEWLCGRANQSRINQSHVDSLMAYYLSICENLHKTPDTVILQESASILSQPEVEKLSFFNKMNDLIKNVETMILVLYVEEILSSHKKDRSSSYFAYSKKSGKIMLPLALLPASSVSAVTTSYKNKIRDVARVNDLKISSHRDHNFINIFRYYRSIKNGGNELNDLEWINYKNDVVAFLSKLELHSEMTDLQKVMWWTELKKDLDEYIRELVEAKEQLSSPEKINAWLNFKNNLQILESRSEYKKAKDFAQRLKSAFSKMKKVKYDYEGRTYEQHDIINLTRIVMGQDDVGLLFSEYNSHVSLINELFKANIISVEAQELIIQFVAVKVDEVFRDFNSITRDQMYYYADACHNSSNVNITANTSDNQSPHKNSPHYKQEKEHPSEISDRDLEKILSDISNSLSIQNFIEVFRRIESLSVTNSISLSQYKKIEVRTKATFYKRLSNQLASIGDIDLLIKHFESLMLFREITINISSNIINKENTLFIIINSLKEDISQKAIIILKGLIFKCRTNKSLEFAETIQEKIKNALLFRLISKEQKKDLVKLLTDSISETAIPSQEHKSELYDRYLDYFNQWRLNPPTLDIIESFYRQYLQDEKKLKEEEKRIIERSFSTIASTVLIKKLSILIYQKDCDWIISMQKFAVKFKSISLLKDPDYLAVKNKSRLLFFNWFEEELNKISSHTGNTDNQINELKIKLRNAMDQDIISHVDFQFYLSRIVNAQLELDKEKFQAQINNVFRGNR